MGGAYFTEQKPPAGVVGRVFYAVDTRKLYVDTGAVWLQVSADLDDLVDVDLTGLADGELLSYDDGTGTWVPTAAPTTPALGDLTDVDTTGAAAGQVLEFNGTSWVPATDDTGGGGGGGGSSLLTGSYAGDGTDPQTVNLAAECDLLFVFGTNSNGGTKQGWAGRGFAGYRYGFDDLGAEPAIAAQVELAADGLSFDVTGTGANGMNESGGAYEYVAIPSALAGGGGGGGGGGVAFAGAKVEQTAGQSLANNALTQVAFDTVHFDPDGFFDDAADRLVVPAGMGGTYLFTASVHFASNNVGVRRLYLRANGAYIDGSQYATADVNNRLTGVTVLELAEGDYVEVEALQNSGGALAFLPSTTMSLARLDAGGGVAALPQFTGAKVKQTSDQALTNAAWTDLTWPTPDYDSDALYDAGSPTVLTIPPGQDGTYLVTGQVAFAANGTGVRYLQVQVNDAGAHVYARELSPVGSYPTYVPFTTTLELVAGDEVKLRAFQNSGGSLNTYSSEPVELSLVKLAGAGGGDHSHPDTADTEWHVVGEAGEPAFENGWVNYQTVSGDWMRTTAAFRKDAEGFVHLRGMIKNGTVGAAAFTLPAGYRPDYKVLLGAQSNNAAGRVDICAYDDANHADGAVVPANPSTNSWVSLDGLTFFAEQ